MIRLIILIRMIGKHRATSPDLIRHQPYGHFLSIRVSTVAAVAASFLPDFHAHHWLVQCPVSRPHPDPGLCPVCHWVRLFRLMARGWIRCSSITPVWPAFRECESFAILPCTLWFYRVLIRFGPMERARIEEEREKRDRDMKEMEMKSRMASLSAAQQNVPAFEAQMAEYQRRFGQMPPHFGLSFPPGGRERLGMPHGPESLHSQQIQEQNERMAALSDPLGAHTLICHSHDGQLIFFPTHAVRLQMANLAASELQHHAHTHAHTHAHAHTHLHLHPHDAAAMAGAPPGLDSASVPSIHTPHPLSLPSGPPGMRPPGLMPRTGELMHPGGLFRPQLTDELLAQQVCPQYNELTLELMPVVLLLQISSFQHHEQMQRMLMDRERAVLFGPGNPHPFG